MAPIPSHRSKTRSPWLLAGLMAAITAVISACKSSVPDSVAPPDSRAPGSDTPSTTGPMGSKQATPAPTRPATPEASNARSPRDYRKDAARHLYGLNAERIFKGKLPPQLYAIGVLEVDVDRAGRVSRVHWLRAPRHAPEVVTEIERTARAAAPYPVPARMGKVTYTDTWLWDKSGKFQLDTLTEGQL